MQIRAFLIRLRVHAEVRRREGDQYFLQDLVQQTARFTTNIKAEETVALAPGGRIQIGETEIEFTEAARGTARMSHSQPRLLMPPCTAK